MAEKKAAEKAKVTKPAEPKVAVKKPEPVKTVVKETSEKKEVSKIPKESFYGTGKRKSAIAKVWIFKGTGKVIINKMPSVEYVGSEVLASQILKPLRKLALEAQYDCRITCLGGGIVGQVGACQLGIARALLLVNSEFRKPLKEDGFLTRDARVKERKKYGRKRARKGFQFRKR